MIFSINQQSLRVEIETQHEYLNSKRRQLKTAAFFIFTQFPINF